MAISWGRECYNAFVIARRSTLRLVPQERLKIRQTCALNRCGKKPLQLGLVSERLKVLFDLVMQGSR
jgi:hypothetical protein